MSMVMLIVIEKRTMRILSSRWLKPKESMCEQCCFANSHCGCSSNWDHIRKRAQLGRHFSLVAFSFLKCLFRGRATFNNGRVISTSRQKCTLATFKSAFRNDSGEPTISSRLNVTLANSCKYSLFSAAFPQV